MVALCLRINMSPNNKKSNSYGSVLVLLGFVIVIFGVWLLNYKGNYQSEQTLSYAFPRYILPEAIFSVICIYISTKTYDQDYRLIAIFLGVNAFTFIVLRLLGVGFGQGGF